ncbi:DUF309 domain-containing protein [Streptomyces sp. H27-D2]|nr:DUF309 domain-containing protein [Streptomyces sp. H27-D2]MEC4017251.1 DUF309 domain-containing protein [Streptomyces sp. H27-D2]
MNQEHAQDGGDPACWLDQICDACGRVREGSATGDVCEHCGAGRSDRADLAGRRPGGGGPAGSEDGGDGAGGGPDADAGLGAGGADAGPDATAAPDAGRGPDATAASRTDSPAASRRDRDPEGRARNARPRDGLGRPLPYGTPGVERQPEGVVRTPDAALTEAQRLLDAGMPFHAHEVLEDAWKSAPEAERALWRGMAQLAVGLTHAARGNISGARTLLTRAADGIAAYRQDPPHGIDIAGLIDWARRLTADIGTGPPVDAGRAAPVLRVG